MEPSRYAKLEDERRFLVAVVPHAAVTPRLIEDRYVRGTRLRLRRVSDGDRTVFKLGQKVPVAARPSAVYHTSLYLDEVEFELLRCLGAETLTKRRWTLPGAGCADEFLGALEGLVLLEGERPFDEADRAVEVTDDERYRGGALAALDDAAAASLVVESRARAR